MTDASDPSDRIPPLHLPQGAGIFVQDIKLPWLNVARRMQSVSKTEGFALIAITVLVGPDGCPRAWTEPKCTKIEPKRSNEDLLNMLGI